MSNPKDYTVGWICAVLKEYTAAHLFLDLEHEPPIGIAPSDTNHYTLGEIAGHYVVMAVLPDGEYGVGSAASVVTNMLRSFPNIRIGLMVGIGGGAPTSKNDIRLGDVVVSSPGNGTGGIYQYDMGKTIQELGFVQTGFLDQPSDTVRSALPGLRRRYDRDGHQIKRTIDSILNRWPRLKKRGFARPSLDSDRLFATNITHPNDSEVGCEDVCAKQQASMIVRRLREDDDDDPAIHYGLIASGNQLMKNAVVRDKLAKEKGILCFEMEAAGLMNRFPCMVIRGICDYSDSHKNKDWQGYAALTAAAYAKDLLKEILPHRVVEEERLAMHIDQLSEDVRDVSASIKDIKSSQQAKAILTWLAAPDPSTNHNRALEKHSAGTGQWFHFHERFMSFKTAQNDFLWLYGPSGCGKTVLSSTIIEHLIEADSDPVIFFYFDFNDQNKQNFEDMLRCFLVQLYHKSPLARTAIGLLHTSHRGGSQQPSIKQMDQTLTSILGQMDGCKIVIDALDESKTYERVLRWCKNLQALQTLDVRLLVTSQTQVVNWQDGDQILPITVEDVNQDIGVFVNARLDDDEFMDLHGQSVLRERVKKMLVKKAGGMFRWAALQLDQLSQCHNKPAIEKALEDLPNTLNDTYARILTTIKSSPHYREVVFILKMLIWSDSDVKMTIAGYNDAIVVRPDVTPAFDIGDRLFDLSSVVSICSGLVMMARVGDTNILTLCFAHASVKDFLLSPDVPQPFQSQLEEKAARVSIMTSQQGHTDVVRDLLRYGASARAIDHFAFLTPPGASALSVAAEYGHFNIVRMLAEAGACINYLVPGQYGTALYAASKHGHFEIVQLLIEQKADPNIIGGTCGNALMAAIQSDHAEIVSALISCGADVNTVPWEPGSPQLHHVEGIQDMTLHVNNPTLNFLAQWGHGTDLLQTASLASELIAAKALLEMGADTNTLVQSAALRQAFACGHGFSPLQSAAASEKLNVVRILIEAGAEINAIGYHGTAFALAVENGSEVIIDLLLDRADVNLKRAVFLDGLDWAPLDTAVAKRQVATTRKILSHDAVIADSTLALAAGIPDNTDTVKLLIEAKASHGRDIFGRTALQNAAVLGQETVVEMLLRYGADVDAPGPDYTNSIHFAKAGVIKHAMLVRGVEIDVQADGLEYGTALQAAVHRGHYGVVQILLDYGASISTPGPKGDALGVAASSGNLQMVEMLLLSKKSKIEDQSRNAAWRIAAEKGHLDVVKRLLYHHIPPGTDGADGAAAIPSAQDEPTPLRYACHINSDDMARLVLANGADVNARDQFNLTPLQYCCAMGHETLISTLLSHNADIEAPHHQGSALIRAVDKGHFSIVITLLNHGANADDLAQTETPLIVAASRGDVPIVTLLLDHGVKVDHSCPGHSHCALYQSVANGHEQVTNLLLSRGADTSVAIRDARKAKNYKVLEKLQGLRPGDEEAKGWFGGWRDSALVKMFDAAISSGSSGW
ncbi:purine and uridine phosphorylase [Aureobasidium sp. EXF-10728]|nr:purine and uridine phosphorylase [Aureobasidium sp. EXF-10728]